MKQSETIFKVGDKVFDINTGWSVVTKNDYHKDYPILLENNMMYTSDGKYLPSYQTPLLSFTEYTLQGFSQERLKEPLPFKVGDVVYVGYNNNIWYTDFLKRINEDEKKCFEVQSSGDYPCLAIENPLTNPETKIYRQKDL